MRCVPRVRSGAKSWPPSKRCVRSWTMCPRRHGWPLTSLAWATRSARLASPPVHPTELEPESHSESGLAQLIPDARVRDLGDDLRVSSSYVSELLSVSAQMSTGHDDR